MGLLGFFISEPAKIYGIDGELKAAEDVHLTRQSNSNTDFAQTYKYKGLLQSATVLQTGDLVVTKQDKFLVTAMRKTPFLNTNQANLWKCDYVCSVYRLKNQYDGTNKIGIALEVIKKNIPCVQKDTNGKMKYFDAGLLESTIKIVYIQSCSDLELGDRLIINNKNYQIDSIDMSVKDVMCLQLSDDKRAVNEEY